MAKRGDRTWALLTVPLAQRAGPGWKAKQMAGRSRGKVCKGRKELGEWEHKGEGPGSRCFWVPRFLNGLLQQMISSGLRARSGCWCFTLRFHHHKRVKEFRITCYVLSIQRKTRVFAVPIAKKTPPMRNGTAQKPTQRCIKAARDRGDGEETPSSVPLLPWRAGDVESPSVPPWRCQGHYPEQSRSKPEILP